MNILQNLSIGDFLHLVQTLFLFSVAVGIWWNARETRDVKEELKLQTSIIHQQYLTVIERLDGMEAAGKTEKKTASL